MDSSVTQIIEAAVNSVPGIDSIGIHLTPGRSTVKVTFSLDKNIDVAFNEVQVQRSTRRSAGCRMIMDMPVVSKTDANGSPIVWLALTGDRTEKAAVYLRQHRGEKTAGNRRWRRRGGAAQARRAGDPRGAGPVALAGYNLTPAEVKSAFGREHLQQPGGTVVNGSRLSCW